MLRAMILAVGSAAAAGLLAGPAPPSDALAPAAAVAAARPAPARAGWGWPLDPAPAVVHAFHAPPTPWSAGHRGVDLRARVGQPVLAAADGRVSFAGIVAGRGVVVVAHAGGLRTSYEPVGAAAPLGSAVRRSTRIGVLAGTAGHCGPVPCLHWGLRRGEIYLDPLACLRVGPPVLKPMLGAGAAAVPHSAVVGCSASG